MNDLKPATAVEIEQNNYKLDAVARFLSPRTALSLLALVVLFAAVFIQFVLGSFTLFLFAGALVALCFAISFHPQVLLAMLLIRPVLGALPELSIAGRQIGIDGVLNIGITAAFMLVLLVKRPVPWRLPVFYVAAGFLLVTLWSLRLSTDQFLGFRQWFRFLGYIVYFCMAYTLAANDTAYTRKLMLAVAVLALIMLSMGVLQMGLLLREFSFSEYVRLMFEPGLENRLDGFQKYPHAYGDLMLLCAPILLSLATGTERLRLKYLYYALAGSCITAALVTGVRTTFVALTATLLLFLILERKYKTIVSLGVLVAAVGLLTGIFQARFDDLINPKRAPEWDSMEDRREIWFVVDRAIAQRPLTGYGLGSVTQFVSMSPLRSNILALSSHCDYRKFAFAAGLPGMFLFISMWVSLLLTLFFMQKRGPAHASLSAALIGVGVGFMLTAMVNEFMQDYASNAMFWSLAGAAIGTSAPLSEAHLERNNQTC